MVAPGDHDRHVNGILGLLVKTHFPGKVNYAGQQVLATKWKYYFVTDDD